MIYADAFEVPFVQPVDALVDFYLVMPAEAVQLADVRELAEGAVRFGGVPAQLTSEADFLHYLPGDLADADFLACAHVYVAVADFGDAVGILHGCIVCVLEVHIKEDMH